MSSKKGKGGVVLSLVALVGYGTLIYWLNSIYEYAEIQGAGCFVAIPGLALLFWIWNEIDKAL